MLLQYMHKCSRRKSQDTVILSLATAPSLFLSFTIFWKELSSQNFISTSSLHLLLLPPQSTETHQTPTTPHPPTQISVLISLWCLMPLSTACSIPLLGIYPEKSIIQKDTCTPGFIAALFTIARSWKQPKCPLTDKIGRASCRERV